MPCDWTWVMALNQSHASGNNGDELRDLTSMKPTTWVLPHRPRTCYETWETNPHVQIFTPNIKTYKSQKSTHLYKTSRKTTGQSIIGQKLVVLLGTHWELREHIRERNSLTIWWGTYWELDENNPKKNPNTTPTAPKKKKTWTPWLHSRMISLAAKHFYASFVLFSINLWAHGLHGSDVLLVVPTMEAGSVPMVSAFIIRSGSFDAAQGLLGAYTFSI